MTVATLLSITATAGTTKPATKPSAESMIGDWAPLSRVLDHFGGMNITESAIRWDNGPSSPYEVDFSDERGVMLHMTSDPPPALYNTPYPYLLLHRREMKAKYGRPHEIDASFFESKADAEKENFSMWGVYLPGQH